MATAPKTNTLKMIRTLVDRFIETKKAENTAKAEHEEVKTTLKGLGLGEYEGTDETVVVSEKSSSSFKKEILFEILTDEIGISVRKANEIMDRATVTAKPHLEATIKKQPKNK